jgi:nitroreductase
MEFWEAVGTRRSIRWFRPWEDVTAAQVQCILEAARLTGSPGNVQPWRAVVVRQRAIPEERRTLLLEANNRQRPQEHAPVWIYWFGDPTAVTADNFIAQIALGLRVGSIAEETGWSEDGARAAILEGVPAAEGMAPLHATMHEAPPHVAAFVAAQETVGACTVAVLAAVAQGLGTCLHGVGVPGALDEVRDALGVPTFFIPVWLQLVGHPAESPQAGGQRPREAFESLYADGRWGTPLVRDAAVVDELRRAGLIQPEAPLPGRELELAYLARMFGYGATRD